MEFLFENPFIIIILLGFLSSLFNKGKPEKQKKQQSRPKPFVESKPFPEVQPKPFQPSRPRPLTSTYEEAKAKVKEEKWTSPFQQALEQKREAPVKIDPIPSHIEPVHDNFSQDKEVGPLTEEKIANAIVWAEILGPPRAKKPHRFMNYR